MTELDPDAKALFDLARDALAPPAGAEARIFAKLGAAAGVSAATLAATTSAAGKPVTLLAKLSSAVLQLWPSAHVLPLAVVAFGGTAAGVWSLTRAEPVVPVAAPSATTASAVKGAPPRAVLSPGVPGVASAAPAARESAAPPSLSPPRPVVAPRDLSAGLAASPVASAGPGVVAEPSPSAVAPRDAQAQAELLLIRTMQSAWRSGNDAQLAATIAEHRARFPQGMLSEERDALSAMLACRRSPAQVSNIRSRFAERYARSAYEATVSAACLGNRE